MRHFSENEQTVIRSIVAHGRHNYSYVLMNAYLDLFYKNQVKYDHASQSLVFYAKGTGDIDHELFLSIEDTIIEISLLLEWLEDNRYIYLIKDTDDIGLQTFSGFDEEGLIKVYKKLDPKIDDILLNALNHRIYVSSDLEKLVEDDFRSYEQMMLDEAKDQTQSASDQSKYARIQADESRKQTRNSWIAIGVSILAIIASSIVSTVSISRVKLVEEQFELIQTAIEQDAERPLTEVLDTVSVKKMNNEK